VEISPKASRRWLFALLWLTLPVPIYIGAVEWVPVARLWLLASMSPEERAAQHQAILRLCGRARTLDHRLLLRLAYNAFAAEAPLQGAILAHRHARVLEREGRTVAARRYERLARRALDRVREEGELDEGTQQVRLRILENLGLLQQRRLDLAAAMESFSQLYRAARALGAPLMAARALRRMGEITERQGQLRDAEPFHRRAHRIARTGGAREEQAASLTSLGLCYTHLGRFEDGRHCFRLALGIWRKLPPSPGRLATIRNLARVHLKLGDLDKARKAYAEIGRLLRDLDDVRERAELQLDLGKFHEISHHYASALEAYQLGVDLARDANQLELWILGMMRLAELHAAARRFDEAFFRVERMLATARSMEDPGHFARALFELGEINALCEDRGTARACYTRVKRLATLHQDALLKIRADLRLAELRSVTAPKEGARMRLMAHEEAETTGELLLAAGSPPHPRAYPGEGRRLRPGLGRPSPGARHAPAPPRPRGLAASLGRGQDRPAHLRLAPGRMPPAPGPSRRAGDPSGALPRGPGVVQRHLSGP